MPCKTIIKYGFFSILLILAGCKTPQMPAPEGTTVQALPPAPSEQTQRQARPADANAGSDEVLARLGDKTLTMQHVMWRVPEPTDYQIARLADSWIETELLNEEAQRRGITDDPRVQFLAEMMKKGAIAQELKTRVQESVEITDQMIQDYYQKNKETDVRLMGPTIISFSHVRTQTREEAEDVLKRIKAGDDINELARKLSIYRDADKGGKTRKSLRAIKTIFGKDFAEVLNKAKVGQVVGPVEIEDEGVYEVVRKDGQTKSEPLPFEQVKEYIKTRLLRIERRKAIQALLDRLEKENADRLYKSKRLLEAEKAAADTTYWRRPKQ